MRQTTNKVVKLERKDICSGPLILVNKENPIGEYISERQLLEISPGICLEKQTALSYEAVIREIGAMSNIVPVSGYRDKSEQERLFSDALRQYGEEYTHTYVAFPGCSEHQTGLAIDVGKQAENIDLITPDFPYSGICQSFRESAVQHGFIKRYPQGKAQVTGIGHEPWHFRYVGIPHSELITEYDFTLEEYIQWIKTFPFEKQTYHFKSRGCTFEIGYVSAQDEITMMTIPKAFYAISGNNIDGFIVTVCGRTI